MIKKLLLAFAVFFILGVGALVYLAAPYVATPKFIVKNESSTPVKITAHWRKNTKDLGELLSGSMIEFEVNDEAAMEFKVTFPNGLVASSSPPVYFTSGTVTNAVVTESSIEVGTQL